jgi:hypothetical protein
MLDPVIIQLLEKMSNMDRRGLLEDRPGASDVAAGTTYWSVDAGDISVSNGFIWFTIGELDPALIPEE